MGEVFLTNFFMGCGPNQTGTFPGSRDRAFVGACAELLGETIRLLRPRALLVLGPKAWPFLGSVAPELEVWRTVQKFAELDAHDLAVVPHVAVDGAPPFGAVTVVHPSGADMGGNRRKRRYRGLEGLEAEAASLRAAMTG